MSNTRTGSGSRSRRVGKLRPQLRFADEITQKSSRLPTIVEENEYMGSDGVAPALSEGPSRSRSSFDVKEFTAIFKIAEQVRVVSDNLDMDSLHSLVEILILCLENMLRSFKSLSSRIRSAPGFDVAFQGVIVFGRMFAHHTREVTSRLSGIQCTDAVQLFLQSLDMMMASLKVLFDLVEHLVTQPKPLPDVPVGSVVDDTLALPIQKTTAKDSPIPVIASHDNVDVALPPAFTAEDGPDAPTTFAITKASLRRLVSGLHGKSIRRLPTLRSGTISSKPSVFALIPSAGGSPSDQVPTTPVASVPSDTDTPDQKTRAYGADTVSAPLGTEQSVSVPCTFAQEVDMGLPTSTLELHFSPDGVLCAASLAALVRMLTSTEAAKDPTFDSFFFVSFRFFSKPIEIFNMLVAQYNEGPREPLDPAIDLEPVVKVRVAGVFFLWLRFHWRQQWDAEVVQPLRQYATTRPADDPASITWIKVIRKLNHASRGIDYRGSRIQRTAQTQLTRHTPTPVSLQCRLLFKEVISQGDLDQVDILHFHNPTGREELARQLCLAASELFRDIDPEDAVRYWMDEKSKSVETKIMRLASFENALAYWTSNTIAVRPTVRSCAEVMEFFIEVASLCAELRNFVSGSAIFSGVGLCTTRLLETTEALSDHHKAMATKLKGLFALRSHKSYRLTLALEPGPTVPLMSAFRHDIEVSAGMRAIREYPEKSGNILIDLERYRVISRTIQAMELCHARYNFECISYIHEWLQHVLMGYASRTSDENLRLLDNSSNRVELKRKVPAAEHAGGHL